MMIPSCISKKVQTFGTDYFSKYQSSNNVIIPSKSFINSPPLKKIKAENCTDIPIENHNIFTEVESDQSQIDKLENLKNLKSNYTTNMNNSTQAINLETETKYNCQTDLSIQNINENFTNAHKIDVNIIQNLSKDNVKDEMEKDETNKKNVEKKKSKSKLQYTDMKLTNKTEVDTVTKVDKCTNQKKRVKPSRKINITVNVTYQKLHEEENEDIKYDSNLSPQIIPNPDLSFLDDFDVDELVESLYSCKNYVGNDNVNYKNPTKSETTANNTFVENEPAIFSTNIITEKNLRDSIKIPEIPRTKHETISLKKYKSYSREHAQQVANEYSHSQLHFHDIKFTDVAQNTKKDETTLHSKMRYTKNVTELDFHEEKDLDTTTENRSEVENDHNRKILHYNESENNSEPKINTHNIIEHVNNKQNILKHNFVTKFDMTLGQQLERHIDDRLNITCAVTAVTHYGKYSKIFKCEDPSGQCYAVKVLDNYINKNYILTEKLLSALQRDIPHENLFCVSLIHRFTLNSYRCLMMYYYNSNLEQHLQDKEKPLKIYQICHLAKQLVEAVFTLKIKNIVHNDIKPSHILLDNNIDKLKLCGFDEAYYYPCFNRESTADGTVNYFSPEKILEYTNGYTVDIWSTALVMYKMATNTNLFSGKTSNEVLFEQMCLFGNFPEDMINGSPIKAEHFKGLNFIRNCTNDMVARNIYNLRWNDIETLILSMQSTLRSRMEHQENSYLFKVQLLSKLLQKMLILKPEQRISIEYVLANEFFQQT